MANPTCLCNRKHRFQITQGKFELISTSFCKTKCWIGGHDKKKARFYINCTEQEKNCCQHPKVWTHLNLVVYDKVPNWWTWQNERPTLSQLHLTRKELLSTPKSSTATKRQVPLSLAHIPYVQDCIHKRKIESPEQVLGLLLPAIHTCEHLVYQQKKPRIYNAQDTTWITDTSTWLHTHIHIRLTFRILSKINICNLKWLLVVFYSISEGNRFESIQKVRRTCICIYNIHI